MKRSLWRMPRLLSICRSALRLACVGALVSACADGAVVATITPAPATASSSEPQAASSAPMASASGPAEAAREWTGPVRVGANTTDQAGDEGAGPEPGDAALDYVDIERVSVDSSGQPHWRLRLAAPPPRATTLDPAQTVISYGLAFETTGDDAPDYVVGISNEASEPGGFRVWVTDLATGDTVEQDGPPYGHPVEFAHPDEGSAEEMGTPGMLFTFLPGTRPPGVSSATKFYAWASVEDEGEVVAWDYAPDVGWVGAPPRPAAAAEVTAKPIPPGLPAALAAYPECHADEFDFAGRGTLRGLGLDEATPATPPDIDRVAMIWVTRDLMPYDSGPEGGPVEMTRMLCFEFADGSGGSGWPVDPQWEPPTNGPTASGDVTVDSSPPAMLVLVLVALVAVVGSALAFRMRR